LPGSCSSTDASSGENQKRGALSKGQARAIKNFLRNLLRETLTHQLDDDDDGWADGFFWEDGFFFQSSEEKGFSTSMLDWIISGLRWLYQREDYSKFFKDHQILNEHFILHVRNPQSISPIIRILEFGV